MDRARDRREDKANPSDSQESETRERISRDIESKSADLKKKSVAEEPLGEKSRGRAESADDNEAGKSEKDRKSGGHKRRNLLIGALIVVLIVLLAGSYGGYWYVTGRFWVSTDDAYTQADDVTIAPQVPGYVHELYVTDNQQVRKGQVLITIDARLYQAQVDQAKADLTQARANVSNADAQINLQDAVVAQAESDVVAAQATVVFAKEEVDRYTKLVKTGAGTVQDQQRTSSNLRQQQAELAKADAALETEQKRQGVLETQKQQNEAAVQKAQAALEQAETNLSYVDIRAPIDGVVGDRSVEIGQYVEPGVRLLTLVPMDKIYVVANFKETQLERMHRGQAVEIFVDAYPSVTIHGRVDSLAPGSGSQFALLPPENATGNFTKIVQRVPVKILLDNNNVLRGRIRPGLSVIPEVDTRDTRGQALEDRPSQEGLPPPSSAPLATE
jgi:membrane fusion protein (multidrug efflux system)